MKIWICEKCGREMSGREAHKSYSFSKLRNVDLCKRCLKKHDDVIHKADKEFYKENMK